MLEPKHCSDYNICLSLCEIPIGILLRQVYESRTNIHPEISHYEYTSKGILFGLTACSPIIFLPIAGESCLTACLYCKASFNFRYVQEETPISSTWTLTPTYRASDLLSVSDTDIKTLFGHPTTMLLLHLSDDSITFVINPLICNGLYQCPSLMSFWKISSFFNWVNKVRTCITTRSNYKRQQRFESVTDELQGPCYHLESIWLSWFVK